MWARGYQKAAAAAAGALIPGYAFADDKKLTSLRKSDFELARHRHGKTRVRVLKVRKEDGVHSVSEYNVETTLYSPIYERCFTKGDNAELVATDTQKNTVYVVAKRSECRTPEDLGLALCDHLLTEYPMLTGCEAKVEEVTWGRALVSQVPHAHGFLRTEPEHAKAVVRQARDEAPDVTSSIEKLVLLKTTQSGFAGFHRDQYTLLPECQERCMATELTATWRYSKPVGDYASARADVRSQICRGFFGPPARGVFSESLQATIYDAGCLVLDAVPAIQDIEIDTPNLHYIPAKLLDSVGEKFDDDVFVPTSEPSGSINCVVARSQMARRRATQELMDASKARAAAAGLDAVQAEAAAEIRKNIVTRKANSCPMAVRLAWHASGTFDAREGTGGSDGATMRFAPESTEGANAGLNIERDILKPVSRAVPAASVADVWTLAGAQAVEVCGGPKIEHRMGRTDAEDGSAIPAGGWGRLPDASQGAEHLRDVFYRMGFDDREIVALSGAHTLGRCHKTRSGFDGPWTSKPLVFDNEYFRNLMDKEWTERDWDGNRQFTDPSGALTMLPTDLALKTDKSFAKYARAYADDESLFFADFKKAFEKLISLGTDAAPSGSACPHKARACPTKKAAPAQDAKALDDKAAAMLREECMHGSIEHAQKIFASRPGLPTAAGDVGSGRTALHKASFWGHFHLVPWLVDTLKVPIDARDADGDTGLHDAARFGHLKVVEGLVARGASLTAKNAKGQTPYDVARENDQPRDVLKLLH